MANVLVQAPNRKYKLIVLVDAERACFAEIIGVKVIDLALGLPSQLRGVCALLRGRTGIEGFLSFLDQLAQVIQDSGYELSQVLVSIDGYGVDGCCKNSQLAANSLTGRVPYELDIWVHEPESCPAGQLQAAQLLDTEA